MAIPKIIHQTYKSVDIPDKFSRYREHLISIHPGWEYKFYDDSACREVVRKYFPSFLPIYDRSSVIQRTDIFRVVIVYGEGGFYLDIDVDCLNPLDPLCEFRCVFGEEITLSEEDAARLGNRDRLRVANYMFGSEPGHPFLLYILKAMAEESGRVILGENDILESTGPGLITRLYHDLSDSLTDIVVLPNIDRTCPVSGLVSCHFGNYGKHHHEASWRWEHAGGKPEYLDYAGPELTAEEKESILHEIESKLPTVTRRGDICVLRTFGDDPFDGLSSVYGRSRVIGNVVDDTSRLEGKKVLVAGMPAHYTGKLSGKNKNVVFTTFETSKLPEFWVEALNKYYNYCIVPHEYIKDVFEASGVRIPVTVIQQGFSRYDRRTRSKPNTGEFRIGFLGVPYKRKNLFKAYQACVNLMGKIPGIKLMVHSAMFFPTLYTPETALMENSPFVEWTWGARTVEWTSEWYGRLSCYLFPSSGEGWSFTPRESLYIGIPTLLTDIPVHREIIKSGFCRVIPVREKEKANYEGKTYGEWDRVSVEDIEDAIWDVYQNYGNYLIRAIQGSRWIENKWTNDSSRQRLLEFMRLL